MRCVSGERWWSGGSGGNPGDRAFVADRRKEKPPTHAGSPAANEAYIAVGVPVQRVMLRKLDHLRRPAFAASQVPQPAADRALDVVRFLGIKQDAPLYHYYHFEPPEAKEHSVTDLVSCKRS